MFTTTVETVRLMVVSSDPSLLALLGSVAQSNAWQLESSASGWEAMERVQSDAAPHLLLLDVRPGDGEGLHLLLWMRRLHPDLAIVVLCDRADKNTQKEATRMGATDLLLRPMEGPQLESMVRKNLGLGQDDGEADMASEDIESLGEEEFFLSISPVMQKVRAQAELLAQTDVPVLIVGEPGSGKGTVGRLIHKLSVHAGFKFLRVNCSEMPADLLDIELFGRRSGSSGSSSLSSRNGVGKLEGGEKGTLLLDEITAMPLTLQSRLLHVLQDRRFTRSGEEKHVEVAVRILATSSDKLDRALAEKRLHEALYYRLSAFTIQVPPLRQRREEINALLRYSMHKLARYYGLPAREFTASTISACLKHAWPGNVEELQLFVKRYLVAGESELPSNGSEIEAGNHGHSNGRIQTHHGNGSNGNGAASVKSLKSLIQGIKSETERNAIAAALTRTGWNRKAAARLLGVSYRTMLYKIEQYHITASEPIFSVIPEPNFQSAEQAKVNGKAS